LVTFLCRHTHKIISKNPECISYPASPDSLGHLKRSLKANVQSIFLI